MDLSERRFQDQLAREILISQRLRLVVVAGIMSVCAVFLAIEYVHVTWIDGRKFPPAFIIPIIVLLTFYQMGVRLYVNRHLDQGHFVASWVWYVHMGIEISTVTGVMILMDGVFENPMSVLMAPPALAYTILIALSTLHLDLRMSLFAGALASVEYLCFALYLIVTSETMADLEPVFRITHVYVTKALLLFLCGVGCAFVAHELRRRILDSYKATEARDQEEAANAAKSAFLANMSHEIRTPLNAILGYAQLMDVDSNLSQQQRQAVQTIGSSGAHLLNLINDVLDLSKIESGREELQPVDFDLAEMVLGVGAMFQLRCEQKGLAWSVDVDPPPLMVHGDEGKLRQVLVNLLGNAVKFTDQGRVVLTVKEVVEQAGITEDETRHFSFDVLDTGPGIPPERQAAIFDPFQQAESGHRKGGTGLGLAIAHRHVALMGGTLSVSSILDVETRFSFVLPMAKAAHNLVAKQDKPTTALHLSPGCQVHALVVDDVAENRAVMQQVLERVGVTVDVAEGGEEALNRVAHRMPDIVFMDIQMPHMPGEQVMQRLFDKYGRDAMKMVAVSASVLSHQRQSYLDAGFEDFIDKPVQLARIYDCLVQILGVTFVSGAPATEPDTRSNLGEVALDVAVWQHLKDAADNHSITELRQQISVLEQMGEGERQVAAQLRELAQQFDMAGVLDLLENIRPG